MKKSMKKLIQTLVVAILVSSLVITASAASWSRTFVESGKTCLSVKYTYYNIYQNSSNSSLLSANISNGMNYWAGDREIGGRISCSYVQFTYDSFDVEGMVIHTTPTSDTWNNVLGAGNETGYTIPYTADGTSLAPSLDNSNGASIHHAIIYYNPSNITYSNFSSVNFRCLVAHELGHSFGFSHASSGIMKSGRKNDTELSENDRTIFKGKYGS